MIFICKPSERMPLPARPYDSTVQGSDVNQAARLRKIAQENSLGGAFNVDPALWFKASTARIDLMKSLETRLDEGLDARIATRENSATRMLILALCASVFSIGAALLLSGVMIHRLMRRLGGEPSLPPAHHAVSI